MNKKPFKTNRESVDIENESLQKLREVFPQFVKVTKMGKWGQAPFS